MVDRGGEPALRERAALIEALARARPMHIVEAGGVVPGEQIVKKVLDSAEVLLPLGGLVDLQRERERLRKEIAEAEGHWQRSEAKLASEQFRSRAPPEVVARTEQRRDQISTRLEGLRARLDELT